MNLTILKEKETPMLSRKRVTGEVSFKGAVPSKGNLKKEFASKLKVKAELIEVRHIYNKYGEERAKVIVNIYDNDKVMKILGKKVKAKKDGEQKPEEAK